MPYNIYYAKEQAELEGMSSQLIDLPSGHRCAKIGDNLLVFNGHDDNIRLMAGLKSSNSVEQRKALLDFVSNFHGKINGKRFSGDKVKATFFIHFGSQGADASNALTDRMQRIVQNSAELTGFRFLAVSRYHKHPEGFFKDGKFVLPSEAAIERALKEASGGKNIGQPYPNLRALVLLCKMLLVLPENERLERFGAWQEEFGWEVVNGQCKVFTEQENEFLSKNAKFRELMQIKMKCIDGIAKIVLEMKDVQEKTIRELIKVCIEEITK